MKRIQIDLSNETADKLERMGKDHGHRLKPFLEYLLNIQSGECPEPYVKALIDDDPEEDETPNAVRFEDEPVQSPVISRPAEAKSPSRSAVKTWMPNKNLAAYTEETDIGSGIYSDGKSFAVQSGPVGRQKAHFFQYIHEAEEFLADNS